MPLGDVLRGGCEEVDINQKKTDGKTDSGKGVQSECDS